MKSPAPMELPCPSCGYNVVEQVLQAVGRCSECGTTLAIVEAEPRDSMAARWRDLHRHARPHPVFTRLALVNLMVLLCCFLLFPSCLERYWSTPIGDWVSDLLGYVVFLAVPLGAILLFIGFALDSPRCVVLGILNGGCAVVLFVLIVSALGRL
jgi:hypothetical protein